MTPPTGFTVEIRTPADVSMLPRALKLAPVAYSASALGGALQAEVTVTGPANELWGTLDWLAHRVLIRNPAGQTVWSGVVEAVTVGQGQLQVELSLRDMFNTVAVQYTRSDAVDAATAELTTWATNAASVTAFGTKALKGGLNEATPAQADARRATLLAERQNPLATFALGETAQEARLSCIGIWHLLDWAYYANDTGYVKNEADQTTEQPLGFSLTASNIGFYADNLHDMGLRLANIRAGQWLLITGAAASNGAFQVTGTAQPATAVVVAGVGIWFEASDEINSGGIDVLTAGEIIQVAGTLYNDGYYRIKQVTSATNLIITPKILVDEGDGRAVTLTQGHHITLANAGWEYEGPGAAVTVASYSKIAQPFTPASGTWSAQEVSIQVRITGTVTDTLRVSFFSDVGGVPTVWLAYAYVTAAEVSENFRTLNLTLDEAVSVTAGTNLWLVIERTGAASATNYWSVALGATSATAASCWDGSAWAPHAGALSLLFQVWATVDTATAAANMLTASAFISRVEQQANTGVRTRLFRDGALRIREEIESLANTGDSSAQRLCLAITPERTALVTVAPAQNELWRVNAAGELRAIPTNARLADGLLPVAQWVAFVDLPPATYLPGAVFVEQAGYTVATGQLDLTPRGYNATWEE